LSGLTNYYAKMDDVQEEAGQVLGILENPSRFASLDRTPSLPSTGVPGEGEEG